MSFAARPTNEEQEIMSLSSGRESDYLIKTSGMTKPNGELDLPFTTTSITSLGKQLFGGDSPIEVDQKRKKKREMINFSNLKYDFDDEEDEDDLFFNEEAVVPSKEPEDFRLSHISAIPRETSMETDDTERDNIHIGQPTIMVKCPL